MNKEFYLTYILHVIVYDCEKSGRSSRAILKQRLWSKILLPCLIPVACLACFLKKPMTTYAEVALITVDWAFIHHSLIKKMLPLSWKKGVIIQWRYSFNWGSLYPDGRSLCQVDKKWTRAIILWWMELQAMESWENGQICLLRVYKGEWYIVLVH